MNIKLTHGQLGGRVTPPSSKSQAHRFLIAAALTGGESRITGVMHSQDIDATLDCMTRLGAQCTRPAPGAVTIRGIGGKPLPGEDASLPLLDCGESGSTLRFLIPVALAVAGGGVFTGRGRLMERPQQPYEALFADKGISFTREKNTIRVQGRLRGGVYPIAGNVSSQFITGLLYALALLEEPSEIRLIGPLESSGYVDMTLDALRRFGIAVTPTEQGWRLPGGQRYTPQEGEIEADYSQAAFWYAARALGSPVSVNGLREDSVQGDRVIEVFRRELSRPGEVTLDVRECPDLVPPLALMAALRKGECTNLVGAGRLRIKESDRLDTVSGQLNLLGAQVEQRAESLHILGVDALRGGTVSGCNDHRIAMMLGIAATRCTAPVTLMGAECVAKSYPHFWEDYAALGGKITML